MLKCFNNIILMNFPLTSTDLVKSKKVAELGLVKGQVLGAAAF